MSKPSKGVGLVFALLKKHKDLAKEVDILSARVQTLEKQLLTLDERFARVEDITVNKEYDGD